MGTYPRIEPRDPRWVCVSNGKKRENGLPQEMIVQICEEDYLRLVELGRENPIMDATKEVK